MCRLNKIYSYGIRRDIFGSVAIISNRPGINGALLKRAFA